MAEDILNETFSFTNSIISGVFLNLVFALIVILIGFVIGRMAGKLVKKLLDEIELNFLLKKATNSKVNASKIIGNFTSYTIYVIVFIIALNKLGLATPILYILIISVILVVIISITLAIRDFIPNAFAGLSLHRKGFIDVGDTIKVKGMLGEIIAIDLVETRIMTKRGDIISLPNIVLAKNEVVKVMKKPKRKLR